MHAVGLVEAYSKAIARGGSLGSEEPPPPPLPQPKKGPATKGPLECMKRSTSTVRLHDQRSCIGRYRS